MLGANMLLMLTMNIGRVFLGVRIILYAEYQYKVQLPDLGAKFHKQKFYPNV